MGKTADEISGAVCSFCGCLAGVEARAFFREMYPEKGRVVRYICAKCVKRCVKLLKLPGEVVKF